MYNKFSPTYHVKYSLILLKCNNNSKFLTAKSCNCTESNIKLHIQRKVQDGISGADYFKEKKKPTTLQFWKIIDLV